MTPARILVILLHLVFFTPLSLTSEFDGSLDGDVNLPLRASILDTSDAFSHLSRFAAYSSLPPTFFGPILPWTPEVAGRASGHVHSTTARFALLPEHRNPPGALAFSTFVFRHERTGRWRHALAVLSLTPGLRTEVLGEGHLPENLVGRELHEVLGRLNRVAQWDKRGLERVYGSFVLRI